MKHYTYIVYYSKFTWISKDVPIWTLHNFRSSFLVILSGFWSVCWAQGYREGCTKQRNPAQSSAIPAQSRAIPAQSSAIQRNLEKNIYFPSQNMILQIRQKFLNRFWTFLFIYLFFSNFFSKFFFQFFFFKFLSLF